jgi:hypothetical protein
LNGRLYRCSGTPKMLPPGEEAQRVDCSATRAVAPRLVLLLALLFPSCGGTSSLPPAPSQVTSGLTVYEHANYLGSTALVTSSISNLDDFKGPCQHDSDYGVRLDWNDCISAVRIAPGWHATIYRDTDFHGQSVDVTGDLPNLQLVPGDCDHDGLNDCVSSLRLTPP